MVVELDLLFVGHGDDYMERVAYHSCVVRPQSIAATISTPEP